VCVLSLQRKNLRRIVHYLPIPLKVYKFVAGERLYPNSKDHCHTSTIRIRPKCSFGPPVLQNARFWPPIFQMLDFGPHVCKMLDFSPPGFKCSILAPEVYPLLHFVVLLVILNKRSREYINLALQAETQTWSIKLMNR
jgi:hypothetical protein